MIHDDSRGGRTHPTRRSARETDRHYYRIRYDDSRHHRHENVMRTPGRDGNRLAVPSRIPKAPVLISRLVSLSPLDENGPIVAIMVVSSRWGRCAGPVQIRKCQSMLLLFAVPLPTMYHGTHDGPFRRHTISYNAAYHRRSLSVQEHVDGDRAHQYHTAHLPNDISYLLPYP